MIDTDHGRKIVSHARQIIERAVTNNQTVDPEARIDDAAPGNYGTFVTLKQADELRGCKGFPEPVAELRPLVEAAAVDAALHDPRFPPLSTAELETTTLSTTILSAPTPVETAPLDRPQAIEVGTHGVIAAENGRRGLLLPQVATEHDWDAETFLAETCRKAGLSHDAWRQPATDIQRFEGTVFAETAPGGPIEHEPLAATDS